MNKELQALQDANFGWVQSLDSIWTDRESSDAGLNQDHVDNLIRELVDLKETPDPPGRVFVGQAGIGKTHLVGVLRRRAWAAGCWFVMLDVVGLTDFWKSAALSFVTSLLQEMPSGTPGGTGAKQYEAIIAGVARRFRVEEQVRLAFNRPEIEAKLIVDTLVGGLMKTDTAKALQHRDVFLALALLRSQDLTTKGVAHSWLQGYDVDEETRRKLGFVAPPPSAIQIVRGLLWVMGLAGSTLIAVDQIDGVISSKANGANSDFSLATDFTALLSGGLLDLARSTGRGMLVLTCLPVSWDIIRESGPSPLSQSFARPTRMSLIESQDFVRNLIADRLVPAYVKAGVTSDSATGPFTEAAIASAASGMTPRTVLMRCDEHRKLCLGMAAVVPCHTLNAEIPPPPPPVSPLNIDGEYAAALLIADLSGLIDEKDDGKLGSLLRDAIDLYAKQIPARADYDVVCKADPAQKTPPLHGRLTFIDHGNRDAERHFCFRSLQHSNAVALCSRFKAALTASGIGAKLADRSLIIVRRGPQPNGAKTKELFDVFRKAGGIEIDPSDDDLRTFVALRTMRDAALAGSLYNDFERWLVDRQPLCNTVFFKTAKLCPPPIPAATAKQADAPTLEVAPMAEIAPDAEAASTAEEAAAEPLVHRDDLRPPHIEESEGAARSSNTATAMPSNGAGSREADEPSSTNVASSGPVAQPTAAIPVGQRLADSAPVVLPTSSLPRHTAIIAGAGSGKTVLLRRIVEEAALAGIPAIVIDPNNDLSRLGDAWPEPPEGFSPEDAAKAARYAATVEVVVWTPGVHAGNPLFLSVLPDFAAVGADPDERAQAVTMAADTLGPLADAGNNLKKGVLNDALRAFATKGGALKDMIAFLEELPEGVSTIGKAPKLAEGMADQLKASVATNPLLKAGGAVIDPQVLFHGPDATKTRISVINLSGLASDEAKEDFVNRLQMTLFGWVKKHPAPRGLLYVVDEAQIFIPSGAGALSKTSGVQLVAQARKYGLGMVLATQAPKGIDNKVISNCSTQFLGKQNSPTDQTTVKQMVAATGGQADDVGKLKRGEFYFKSEGTGKPFKLATPLCLSYHPANPPTPEEVVAKARASKP